MRTDLHIHTTASDGRLSPSEVVSRAAMLGMTAISITDHDSVGGIDVAIEEARKFPDLLMIPGVELSTAAAEGEVHILGYFIDHRSVKFCHDLERFRNARVVRAKRMLEKLADLGMALDWDRILDIAAGASVGRPHIAKAMIEQGYVTSFHDAFEHFIGHNKPAYVKREKLTPVESVGLVKNAGGLPVLAHPAEIEMLEPLIAQLKKAGLVGIEVHYKNYSSATIARLDTLAAVYGLIPCGGSDYHGFIEEGDGSEIGQVDVPEESVRQLVSLVQLPMAPLLGENEDSTK